jgi:redox-sensitive bicupin YhaK (pirin superfamily)
MDRRSVIGALVSAPVLAACQSRPAPPERVVAPAPDPILRRMPLGFQWPTLDPFLFCVHHDDAYPAGNGGFGPSSSLAGRRLGSDFELKDGFRMYHGQTVPGFPQHPHRGFETVTIVRRGLVDHADSLGAAARYGQGDVQWLTAGKGIVHAEMFPLLERAAPNPLELFQIWLNLPAADKFAEPHFAMFWADKIPNHVALDSGGKRTELSVIAGRLEQQTALRPPPQSWAARPDTDVAIWTVKLSPGARYTLPAAAPTSRRMLYFFRGESLTLGASRVQSGQALELRAELPAALENGEHESELLLLQGRPIGEPVVQRGPFVMNSAQEIQRAHADYRRTRFGGWPWDRDDPVHGPGSERFARHANGRVERAT